VKILVTGEDWERGKVEVMDLSLNRNLAWVFMQLWWVRKKWPAKEVRLAGSDLVRIVCGEEEGKDEHGKAAGT